MHIKKLFDVGRKGEDTSRRDLLTPEELHRRAEELWAALRANYYRAVPEGKSQLPNAELLFRLMNLVENILANNKQGRKGFDCGDPKESRASELEVFNSIKYALERNLGWHVTMPLSPEEQVTVDYKQDVREALINHSRRRYGTFVSKDEVEALDMTDEDRQWLRRYRLRPE